MERKSKKGEPSPSDGSCGGPAVVGSQDMSPTKALAVHLMCGISLVGAYEAARSTRSIDLASDPARTLRLFWLMHFPVVVFLFGLFRQNQEGTLIVRAVGRGVVALPAGAIVNALGAIALGAPVHVKYLPRTVDWSLMMSTLNFVPATCVFGSSWSNWQRMFAFVKPNSSIDVMVCVPAYGVVIGAWFGAWPMPLDWNRPWQECPICVSYGAIAVYLAGLGHPVAIYLLETDNDVLHFLWKQGLMFRPVWEYLCFPCEAARGS